MTTISVTSKIAVNKTTRERTINVTVQKDLNEKQISTKIKEYLLIAEEGKE